MNSGGKKRTPPNGARESGAQCLECGVPMELSSCHDEEHRLDYEGYRCPNCGHTVVTLAQMQAYTSARDLRRAPPRRTRIIRIGDDLGIVLPSELEKYGFSSGREVEVTVLDAGRLQIEVVAPDGSIPRPGL